MKTGPSSSQWKKEGLVWINQIWKKRKKYPSLENGKNDIFESTEEPGNKEIKSEKRKRKNSNLEVIKSETRKTKIELEEKTIRIAGTERIIGKAEFEL